ncbi:hypothetical protein P9139_17805 [Curtobacterium flaccumfaciens]|nr:hypothetical protein P9139_17805 [Curtobacterium flaccumfaciens]
MPHLVLVIDEFGELLTAEPEFVDLLLMIGRIGRSIGVHLLLSSQRIEAGKLRGLDTYLSYRLGLRTFSEAESQVVLDTGDAFHLPAVPGYGYLKVDTSVYTRFRSGYASGPVEDATPAAAAAVSSAGTAPEPFELPVYNTLATEDDEPGEATLESPTSGGASSTRPSNGSAGATAPPRRCGSRRSPPGWRSGPSSTRTHRRTRPGSPCRSGCSTTPRGSGSVRGCSTSRRVAGTSRSSVRPGPAGRRSSAPSRPRSRSPRRPGR